LFRTATKRRQSKQGNMRMPTEPVSRSAAIACVKRAAVQAALLASLVLVPAFAKADPSPPPNPCQPGKVANGQGNCKSGPPPACPSGKIFMNGKCVSLLPHRR
jgi:hypothetical protein